jgi:hypothetical protein
VRAAVTAHPKCRKVVFPRYHSDVITLRLLCCVQVVLDELKSLSSRVMFLAVSPEDTLQVGDYAPSARPPAPPQAALDTGM